MQLSAAKVRILFRMNKCFEGNFIMREPQALMASALMDGTYIAYAYNGEAVPLVGAGVKCLCAARRAA